MRARPAIPALVEAGRSSHCTTTRGSAGGLSQRRWAMWGESAAGRSCRLVRVDVNVIQSPSLDEVEHEVERFYLLVEVALALASSRHGGPVVRLECYPHSRSLSK